MANKMDEQIEAGIHAANYFFENVDFGDFVLIEQQRFGAENEIYLYKVINRLRSNAFVPVPVTGYAENVKHEGMHEVISCICCGVDETKVLKFRITDTKPHYGKSKNVLVFNETKKSDDKAK